MNQPRNYDKVSTGDFTPVELGGHHMIIKKVEESKSKAGKAMIIVAFDFAKNDIQPGYFMSSFESDIRPEKKWPANGKQYILTEDKDGNCSKSFKAFVTAFEKSNGCEATWGATFCDQFKNKKIGGVFGIVEEEYNGEVKKRRKLRWFCEDSAADGAKIPEEKLLERKAEEQAPAGFTAIMDDDIPF